VVAVIEHDERGARLLRRPAARDMTIRDLLRHTAGLTYGYFETSLLKDEYIRSGVESRKLNNQDLVQRLATLPLAFDPGTTWEYSRATDVLGALIERLSGRTLGEFLAERVFGPLHMVDTGFWVPPEQHSRIAEPFSVDPDTHAQVRVIDVRNPPVFESGGGGLVSTVADYARFQSMLRAQGVHGRTRLLQEDTVREMTRDHLGTLGRGAYYLPGPDYGFGLGVAVRLRAGNAGAVGEYYWGGLAGTFQWIDPGRDVAAILMLQAPNQRETLRGLFYQEVYRALAAT
jgi:CubicO group peptidase (beta-lactamase class C family)